MNTVNDGGIMVFRVNLLEQQLTGFWHCTIWNIHLYIFATPLLHRNHLLMIEYGIGDTLFSCSCKWQWFQKLKQAFFRLKVCFVAVVVPQSIVVLHLLPSWSWAIFWRFPAVMSLLYSLACSLVTGSLVLPHVIIQSLCIHSPMYVTYVLSIHSLSLSFHKLHNAILLPSLIITWNTPLVASINYAEYFFSLFSLNTANTTWLFN